MDQNFQTSFIPKRALAEDRIERPKSVSVFLFFATILFIASIAGAAFVYFYRASLTSQVAQMKIDLQKAESAFEGDLFASCNLLINALPRQTLSYPITSPFLQSFKNFKMQH